MKKQTRIIGLVAVLIATLLLGATSALAKQTKTPFEAVVVLCETGESAREWYEETDEGTIWHFRNMVYQTYHYSAEPRMAGITTWRGNQDMNLTTGDGRAWGTGVLETEQGAWRIVYTGGYQGWVGYSKGHGRGIDGLKAHAMYYTGSIEGEPPENPCAPNDPYAVMTFSGWIIDRRGK